MKDKQFSFYVNFRTRSVTVHDVECGSANRNVNVAQANGFWSETLNSLSLCQEIAKALSTTLGYEANTCQRCL